MLPAVFRIRIRKKKDRPDPPGKMRIQNTGYLLAVDSSDVMTSNERPISTSISLRFRYRRKKKTKKNGKFYQQNNY